METMTSLTSHSANRLSEWTDAPFSLAILKNSEDEEKDLCCLSITGPSTPHLRDLSHTFFYFVDKHNEIASFLGLSRPEMDLRLFFHSALSSENIGGGMSGSLADGRWTM